MFSNIREGCQVIKDHSKITKMHVEMIKRAKNEVFGHFMDSVLLDQLDIADCVRNRSSLRKKSLKLAVKYSVKLSYWVSQVQMIG